MTARPVAMMIWARMPMGRLKTMLSPETLAR